MPFRKKRPDGSYRPNWYIELDLPAHGPTGCLSSRTPRKAQAERYEAMLRELDDRGEWDLLEALRPRGRGKSGAVTLPQLWKAYRQRRLGELRRGVTDMPLTQAVRQAAKTITYNNHRVGLRHLLRLAPEGARLSYVKDPARINGLVAEMLAEGYKPRTIQNGLWNGLSQLLQFHFGKAAARAILGDANRPTADDRRDVHLSADDLYRAISNCAWEMRMFLLITAGLGIDTSPALRLQVQHVDFARWTVYINDKKQDSRRRTLPCPAPIMYAFKRLAERKGPTDPLITLTSGQIGYRWRKARTAARLTTDTGYHTNARLKDLRHTFGVHYLKGGGSVAGLQNRMGHKRPGQSLDYARHEVTGRTDMEDAVAAMGLVLPDHLRAELTRPETKQAEERTIPAWWYDKEAGPQPLARYRSRGTAGWSGAARKETNRQWMQRYREEQRSA